MSATVAEPRSPRDPGAGSQPAPPAPSRAGDALAGVGGVVELGWKSLVGTIVPPYSWFDEFVEQAWLILKRCLLPTAFANLVFGFGAPGMTGGHIVQLFGTMDRMGAFAVMASMREFAPWVNAMIVAGVVGTSICADLGARKIRQELDAFALLGLDPIKHLVAPRFLAVVLLTPLINIVAGICGVIGIGIASVYVIGGTSVSGYIATFFSNFTMPDLLGNELKSMAFGVIIAGFCCYRGLNVKGGAEGVGRAVNQAVVMSFVGIFVFNFMFTSTMLASFPQTTNLH